MGFKNSAIDLYLIIVAKMLAKFQITKLIILYLVQHFVIRRIKRHCFAVTNLLDQTYLYLLEDFVNSFARQLRTLN